MCKKVLAIVLTTIMLLSMCAVSLAEAAPYRGKVRIVLCEDPPTKDYEEKHFAEFTKKTGIEVEVEMLSSSVFYEKMVLGMASNSQDWDICQMDVSCCGTLLDGGFLMPLDDMIANASEEWLKGYEGSSILENNFRYNGNVYGVPQFMGSAILMYNARHFLDAGLDPENPPKTLEELVEACKKLDTAEHDAIVFRGSREGATLSFFWSMLYFNQGGSWYPEDHESLAIFDTDKALNATKYMVELGKYAPEGIANYTYDECYNAIQQGKASILLDMSQCATWTIDPKLSTVGEDMRFAALDGRTLAGNWSFAVGKSCEQPDLAWELIEYITGYDVTWEQTKNMLLAAPCRVDVLANPELKNIYPASLIKAMKDSQTNSDPIFYPMCAQCDEIVTCLAINANDALTGTITAEDAMSRTQEEVLAIKVRDGLK